MGIIGEILFYGAISFGGFILLVVLMLALAGAGVGQKRPSSAPGSAHATAKPSAAPSRYEDRQKQIKEVVVSAEREETAAFEALYRRSFPDYELMTDIPARTICSSTRRKDAIPVTFLFTQDGLPKLAVLLIEPHEYGKGKIQATESACEAIGLPYLLFFFSFRNDPDYVVSRTRAHLS